MLGELLRAGRSKGACVFLGFQDLASLYEEYQEEPTHSLLNNIGNQAYLKLNDAKSAEWASKFFTEKEVTRASETKDKGGDKKSTHEAPQDRPIVPAHLLRAANAPGKLLGFFDSNEIGSWAWELPIKKVARDVPSPTTEEKELHALQRLEEQVLRPWDDDDMTRLDLKLPPPTEPAKPADEKKPPTDEVPPPPLSPYRKHRRPDDRSQSLEVRP